MKKIKVMAIGTTNKNEEKKRYEKRKEGWKGGVNNYRRKGGQRVRKSLQNRHGNNTTTYKRENKKAKSYNNRMNEAKNSKIGENE